MRLHDDKQAFRDLAVLTAEYIGIPVAAVQRDYYIVLMLEMLENSVYSKNVVFKGGTSLSKCYPGSIMRFSEDIDLTYIPDDRLGRKQYDKALKEIEKNMSEGAHIRKITEERNDRNKSAYVWFDEEEMRVKLEIGSSIRPDPYEKRELKTYIQEYLEREGMTGMLREYELTSVQVNVLCIERTFLDKIMAVKRHAICGTIGNKVRHIYDVAILFDRPDIQEFLGEKIRLKELLQKTKTTDGFYLKKRNIPAEYDPAGAYDFPMWERYLDESVRARYETLHKDLLYTDEKQDFDRALDVFRKISQIFAEIGE